MADSGETGAYEGIGTFVLRSRPSGSSILFPKYSVVGQYADQGARNFVRHVAILKDAQELSAPTQVEVYHTGPPIVAGERSAASASFDKRSCVADVVADIALDAEEREAIDDWLAEVEKEGSSE